MSNQIQKTNGGAITSTQESELRTQIDQFMTQHGGALTSLKMSSATLTEMPEAAITMIHETAKLFAEQEVMIAGARQVAQYIWDFEHPAAPTPDLPTTLPESTTRQKSLDFLIAQRTVRETASGGGK